MFFWYYLVTIKIFNQFIYIYIDKFLYINKLKTKTEKKIVVTYKIQTKLIKYYIKFKLNII